MTAEPAGRGAWLVRAEREHGGESAAGAIRVSADSQEAAGDAAHARIAAGLAWAALARRLLGKDDVEGGLAAARSGIDELGEPPPNPGLGDDTTLKLAAADDRAAAGHPRDAAEVMLDVLVIRIAQHAKAHEAKIVG